MDFCIQPVKPVHLQQVIHRHWPWHVKLHDTPKPCFEPACFYFLLSHAIKWDTGRGKKNSHNIGKNREPLIPSRLWWTKFVLHWLIHPKTESIIGLILLTHSHLWVRAFLTPILVLAGSMVQTWFAVSILARFSGTKGSANRPWWDEQTIVSILLGRCLMI